MHPMQYRSRLFASMASGPLVTFAPEDEGGAGAADDGAGAADESGEDVGQGAEGAGDAGAESAAAGADGGEEEPPKPTRVPWQTKRIDKLSGELKAEREARERAEAAAEENRRRLAAMEALYGKKEEGPGDDGPKPLPKKEGGDRVYTQAELDEEVSRRASLQTLNQQLDKMYEGGKETYGADFEKRVRDAGQAFPDLAQRVDFFKAIAKLPNGTDVYHNLTSDLDRMGEVLDMSPLELGMELARMSQEAATKPKGPQVSRAPAPIDPIDGGARGATKGDAMSEHAKEFEARQARRRERIGY